MKHQFFALIWFLFLSKEQQERYKDKVNIFEDKEVELELLQEVFPINMNDEKSIIDFLFIRSIYSCVINHRRNKIFSFNPKTKVDFIYLVYIENENNLNNLTFSQRILLSRLVFRNKTKEKTFNNIPIEQIATPIVLEVNNV